jgi:hypothetical protein
MVCSILLPHHSKTSLNALPFQVMEFAPGGELYSIIQRGKLKNPDAMLLCAETMLVGIESTPFR